MNNADMVAKGRDRKARGIAHPKAKINERDVRAIRQSEDMVKNIASKYGLASATVSNIRAGRIWKHVPFD